MGAERKGPGWSSDEARDGVRRVECDSWSGFVNFVTGRLLDFRHYIFRGHADEAWQLKSTLDRELKGKSVKRISEVTKRHLENFKLASRGRKSASAFHALDSDAEWWALGQHHGLATPLLDWTESPFVAAYFAFFPTDKVVESRTRVVFALSRSTVERRSAAKRGQPKLVFGPIEVVRPMNDQNARLISQRGLFTKGPPGVCLIDWVSENFVGETTAKLIRISMPSEARDTALKSLNRMNVNHLSLFPDLTGAAAYCNLEFTVNKY